MFIIIVFLLGRDRPTGLIFFVSALLLSILSPLYLLFCFFVLFHSCSSHVRVFRKTLVHECFHFHISYRHTEWYVPAFFAKRDDPCFSRSLAFQKLTIMINTCLFVSCHCCCSHAEVLGTTFVQELHICYSHAECWKILELACCNIYIYIIIIIIIIIMIIIIGGIGEEQCGFRQGRGCMDQVFAVRQVCESISQMGKMYSGLLWIWKRSMILSIVMVCGRC